MLPLRGSVRGCFFDQRVEEGGVVARFRMPEDAHREAPGRVLERLDRPVRCPGGFAEALAQLAEPLVVVRLHVVALTEERFLILPHPQVGTFWAQKASDPDRWLAGIRRLIDTP